MTNEAKARINHILADVELGRRAVNELVGDSTAVSSTANGIILHALLDRVETQALALEYRDAALRFTRSQLDVVTAELARTKAQPRPFDLAPVLA